MSVAVLDALEARAGASDTDREAWLAERAGGITATNIRDLMLGEVTDEELADLKLGRKVDSFSGNAYTAWGNEREPVIAAVVQQRYGIAHESRVFHAASNSRHLASPDGVGVDFDEALRVSEIKTVGAKYDLVPWGADFEAKGYGYQVQWNLHVLGAERCLFSWEERLGMPGRFRPGMLRHEWVARDEAVIARLVERADRFLAVLDARAASPAPEADEAVIDEVVDTHAVNYLRFIDEEKQAKAAKEREYQALLKAGRSQTSTIAKVTYTPAKPGAVVEVEDVDYEAARWVGNGPTFFARLQDAQRQWDEHCDQFKVTRQETGKGTAARVTVTAVKQKGMPRG